MIGYTKKLYILPFDHRASYVESLFGYDEGNLLEDQLKEIKESKHIIYEGFLKAIETDIPKSEAALLVDETYGKEILLNARQKGVTTILTTEKSGQKEFELEFGDDFGTHIKEVHPTFTKALLRYNPQGDRTMNIEQLNRLKILSDYSYKHSYKFLVEPLIPPTDEQLNQMSKEEFDTNLRPQLTVRMIEEFQKAGVEPDVWKIEGLHNEDEYKAVVKAAQTEGRESGIVILGRAAPIETVDGWIIAGREVPGVIGFAVGRTIFWEPLVSWHKKTITREEAVEKIAACYIHFYKVFTKK